MNVKVSPHEKSEDFIFGTNLFNNNRLITWNPGSKEVANPHLCIMGASGTGKTTLLRSIIRYLQSRNFTLFILDFHGDINSENEECYRFEQTNSPYGLSIFDFDNDPVHGGIRARILEIVQTFKKSFMPNMGPVQEAVLKQLLSDTYRYKGFEPDNPDTWNSDKELPRIEDLYELINTVESTITAGPLYELETLMRKAHGIFVKKNRELNDKDITTINKIKDDVYVLLDKYFQALEKGGDPYPEKYRFIDWKFYTTKNALKSLESIKLYVLDMMRSGVFSAPSPKPKRKVIRFDLSPLNEQLIYFLSDIIIQRIFRRLKNIKYMDNKVKTYIVIDESKLILPTGKEKENPFNFINRIVSESRKYGLGIILVSQRIAHYSDEILSNIDTKILLRIHENDVRYAKSKLGIKDDAYFRQLASKKGVVIINKGGKIDVCNMNYSRYLF